MPETWGAVFEDDYSFFEDEATEDDRIWAIRFPAVVDATVRATTAARTTQTGFFVG